jgi:formyltetrahydrofolate dehydrogenase
MAKCLLFQLNVERISLDGRMMNAAKFGKAEEAKEALEFTETEKEVANSLKEIWKGILNIDVEGSTNFFATGAGSMDVVR